jgi:hypothetical protein
VNVTNQVLEQTFEKPQQAGGTRQLPPKKTPELTMPKQRQKYTCMRRPSLASSDWIKPNRTIMSKPTQTNKRLKHPLHLHLHSTIISTQYIHHQETWTEHQETKGVKILKCPSQESLKNLQHNPLTADTRTVTVRSLPDISETLPIHSISGIIWLVNADTTITF